MRTRFIKLGDGYAVRVPTSFIEQADLGKSFHILAEHGQIVLRRYKNPRYGWVKAMREAVRKHGSELTEEDAEWLNAPLGPLPKPAVNSTRANRSRARPRQ